MEITYRVKYWGTTHVKLSNLERCTTVCSRRANNFIYYCYEKLTFRVECGVGVFGVKEYTQRGNAEAKNGVIHSKLATGFSCHQIGSVLSSATEEDLCGKNQILKEDSE